MSEHPKKAANRHTPPGVVGIYTDKEGRVIASVSDFDTSGYGGLSRQEAQQHRCRRKLTLELVDQYCSSIVSAALGFNLKDQIVDAILREGGKITFIPIGDADEEGNRP